MCMRLYAGKHHIFQLCSVGFHGVMQPEAKPPPLVSSVTAKWQEWRQRKSLSPERFHPLISQGIKAVSGARAETAGWYQTCLLLAVWYYNNVLTSILRLHKGVNSALVWQQHGLHDVVLTACFGQ